MQYPVLPIGINGDDAPPGELCNLPRGDIAVVLHANGHPQPLKRAVSSGQVWVTIAQADAAKHYGWEETGVTDGYLTIIAR